MENIEKHKIIFAHNFAGSDNCNVWSVYNRVFNIGLCENRQGTSMLDVRTMRAPNINCNHYIVQTNMYYSISSKRPTFFITSWYMAILQYVVRQVSGRFAQSKVIEHIKHTACIQNYRRHNFWRSVARISCYKHEEWLKEWMMGLGSDKFYMSSML